MGKLKRILLRYDPPGIGLEIQDAEGNLTIKHQDLPPSGEVDHCSQLSELADKVIEEEAHLLSKAKHHDALMTLMARLYQLELDLAYLGCKDDAAKEQGPPSKAAPGASGLREGQQAMLVGMPRSELNGEIVVIEKLKEDKDKYEVVLNGETLKVKGRGHLVPILQNAVPIRVGSTVAIRGLRNHLELNGCIGQVVEANDASQRYEVRALESGQLLRVKLESLIELDSSTLPDGCTTAFLADAKENREPNTQAANQDKAVDPRKVLGQVAHDGGGDWFPVGATVEFFGLKTASSFNGMQAVVLNVDHARNRYEIRLTDGSVKTAKADNVRLAVKA